MTQAPQFSQQISSIVEGDDDGWGILYRAKEMKASGQSVTMLAMGDHDFTTPRPIIDACGAALDAGRTGYSSIQGIDPLRNLVAKRASAVHGIEVDPACVVATVGGQSALFVACMASLDPGDEAIIFEPYYATYAQTVRAVGGRPVIIGTDPDAGFQPSPERIAAAITPRTRAIVINTPNNPTGAVYTRKTLEGIAELCIAHNIWLISDEVYHTQVYDGAHLSPAGLDGMRERILIIDSMSKSHAMTGWRAGWLICPSEAQAEHIVEYFLTATHGLPPFIQLSMRAGLALGAAPEQEIAARYRQRRDVAVETLSQSKRLTVHAPAAAMYVFLDLRGFCQDGNTFAEALLDKHGVAAMAGESFGVSGTGHLRISLTAPDEELRAACKKIAELADNWP